MSEKPSVKIYKTIAYAFIAIAVILIGIIVFVSLSKAEITIYPDSALFESDFVLTAKTQANKDDFEKEQIVFLQKHEIETSISDTFKTTGIVENKDNIVGTVLLINESQRSQPLIASTRLETTDGLTLRLSEKITLKPGDRMMASVYADDLDTMMGKEIATQKLHIPGLWEGLRELIYAQVNESFIINPQEMKAVAKEDIQMAQDQLVMRLEEELVKEKQIEFPDQIIVPLKTEVTGFQPSAQAGDLAMSFDALVTGKVTLGFISKEQLRLAGYQILKKRLRPNQNLLKFDDTNFVYTLSEWDEKEEVKINVHFEGRTTLAPIHEIVDKKELMGKSKKEVFAYFQQFPNISQVEVKFTPSWMLKTPLLLDHIQIQIGE